MNRLDTDTEATPLKRAIETMGLIAGLIGSITAIVTAYNELAAFALPAIERWFGTAPLDLVVSVAPDRPAAQIYNRILTEAGLRVKSLTVDQIQSLGMEPAGVVIIDGMIHLPSASIAGMFNRRPLEKVRLIGMGAFGGELIREIEPDTNLADLEHERNDPVIFGVSTLPLSITAGLPTDRAFNLYTNPPRNEFDNAAVYDRHSLPALGAFGIVRRATSIKPRPCAGSYWPVVQQGRFVLWGYNDDPGNLTEEGKHLLANIVRYLLAEQTEKGSVRTADADQTPPLHYSDRLECTGTASVDEQIYPFTIDQPGTIKIKVDTQDTIALILNGPGRINAYARNDGVAPEITYTVTQPDLEHGKIWRARVTDFALKPGGKVPYTITIDFPPHRVSHWFIWAAVGLGGLVLFGAIVILSLRRLKVLKLRGT